MHSVLSDAILSVAFFVSDSARQIFSSSHGSSQLSYGVINSLWCPVRLLVRLLAGFSLIELSVGLTGHKAGFHL